MIGTRSAICGGATTVVSLNFTAILSLLVLNENVQEAHTHNPRLVNPVSCRRRTTDFENVKVTFAPQSKSDPSLLSVLQQTHAKAHQNCYTDYSFHLLISNPTSDVLSEFSTLREQGISSLKIYMTYEALQLRDNQILDVLLEARRNGITTMIHAENGDILSWMTEQLETRGLFAPKYHATSRPHLVETEATNRAIVLASIIDTPILIVHVSSASAAVHIRHAQSKGLPIYAETCPQYLFLTRSDLDKPGFEGAKCVW